MEGRLKGKAAVVTGAGRGIGREIALALAAEGVQVVAVDPGVGRDGRGTETGPANEVADFIKKRGGNAVPCYESVADYNAAGRIIKTCIDSFGKIDFLYNVAGILREKMIFNMPEEDWDAVITVHLKGTFNCTKHACVAMKEQKSGRIINTTSHAWLGSMGQSNYSAAKGGIVSFTKTISNEMAKYGVTVNAICPGAGTRMTMTEEVKAGFKKRLEAGLITQEQYEQMMNPSGPEYVPPIAVYLATDQAAGITGKVFGCSGGQVTLFSDPAAVRGIYKDYKKDGPWTLDELDRLVPQALLSLR